MSGGILDIPSSPDSPFQRKFTISLLSSQLYEVLISGPQSARNSLPSNFTIGFADGGSGCSDSVTLRIRAVQGRQWQVVTSDYTMPS